jgi:hypothetical protein
MNAHLVELDPETHTVRIGAGVTRLALRRLYGLVTEELLSVERVNGIVVSRTFTARPAPPLVVAHGGRAGQPGAAALEADLQLAAGEAHRDVAVAVGGGRDGHRTRP